MPSTRVAKSRAANLRGGRGGRQAQRSNRNSQPPTLSPPSTRTTRSQASRGQNQPDGNLTAHVPDDSNGAQEPELQPQHNAHPGVANLDEIRQRHAILQASGTIQVPATPASSQETLRAQPHSQQNLAVIRERHQALKAQQDQDEANRLLAEIAAMEAKNGQYPALQYPGVTVPGTQLQPPNTSFLTGRMPAFHDGMEPRFIPLARRFPTINVEYFRQIADNKFLPENIVKLSTERAQAVKHHVKFMQLSDDQLQFGEYNAKEEDTKFPLALLRQFHIYSQILLAVVLPHLTGPLGTALATYQERLMGLLIKCTFDSVRLFHFAFHRGCIIDGIDQPSTWNTVDSSLESEFLRYKTTHSSFGSVLKETYGSSRAQTSSASRWNGGTGPDQSKGSREEVCLKWNFGKECHNCKYKHVCRDCGGNHTVTNCHSSSNPNSLPLNRRA